MITRERIKARRDQIAAFPFVRFSDNQRAICSEVIAHIDAELASGDCDCDALWETVNAAMGARLADRPWTLVTPKGAVASDPAPDLEISPRTGRPKRKYTRRKKAK